MASSRSVFLTAVVSMVLGIVIGVFGLAALTNALTLSADQAAAEQDAPAQQPKPYGER
jgi:hypothetical protein